MHLHDPDSDLLVPCAAYHIPKEHLEVLSTTRGADRPGMPEMTGWNVAQAIKGGWPGLPVGMLTGWGDQLELSAADRQLVAGILSKPTTPENLLELIATCRGTPRGT